MRLPAKALRKAEENGDGIAKSGESLGCNMENISHASDIELHGSLIKVAIDPLVRARLSINELGHDPADHSAAGANAI